MRRKSLPRPVMSRQQVIAAAAAAAAANVNQIFATKRGTRQLNKKIEGKRFKDQFGSAHFFYVNSDFLLECK